MSTISRRTFLKLAGVTAVATAGASMLTGCKAMDDVEVTVKLHEEGSKNYKVLGTTKMPYVVVKVAMIDPNGVLNTIKKQYDEYKDLKIDVDKDIPGNGKILTDSKTGKMTMELVVKVATVDVAYTVTVNGKTVATGTQALPKGLKTIPSDKALELVKGKLNYPPYNTATLEIDKDYPNNLTIVNGKVTIALLGYKG